MSDQNTIDITRVKAVVFDMDGVLVDSNDAHLKAFQELGRHLGKPFTREHLERTFGMHNNQIMPLWLGEGLTQEQIEQYGVEKEKIYREIAATSLKAVPGAVALVKHIHALGLKLAVGSSGPRENVKLAVETLGVETFFHARITGSDIRRGKPNPEVFLKAAAALGVEPADCLVIEDAPGGVQAALNAGMQVVAITTSTTAENLAHAHWVVERLSEVQKAFSA